MDSTDETTTIIHKYDDLTDLDTALWNSFNSAWTASDTQNNFNEFKDDWDDIIAEELDHVMYLNELTDTYTGNDIYVDPFYTYLTYFSDNFTINFNNWINTGNNGAWTRVYPITPITYDGIERVASSENCDDYCYLEVKNSIDMTQFREAVIDLYQYVSSDNDNDEGIILEASRDNGVTWSQISQWTSPFYADDTWHRQNVSLDNYLTSSQFKFRIIAKSNLDQEYNQIDNVRLHVRFDNTDDPPSNTVVPNAVDDFAYTLDTDGVTLHFTWSHPYDSGSDITYYRVERSYDGSTWQFHDSYSETTTSFDYKRSAGYVQYFRIFAYNSHGQSASSNILYVTVPDPTPPSVTITSPKNNAALTTSIVDLSGYAHESDGPIGITDLLIKIDNQYSNDAIIFNNPLPYSFVQFQSVLTDLSNGQHTITVYANNPDGYTGYDSIVITVDAPIPGIFDYIYNGFDSLFRWFLTADDDDHWNIRSPTTIVPNSLPGNVVAGAKNCDNVCTMIPVDSVNLTNMISPKMSFYRYVSTSADTSTSTKPAEGLVVSTSIDNGNNWQVLDRFTADENEDDGLWHYEEYDLSGYSSETSTMQLTANFSVYTHYHNFLRQLPHFLVKSLVLWL